LESKSEITSLFWIGTCVMMLFSLAFILLVLFYQRYLFKRKKEEESLVLKAVLEAEKKERFRLAADLHDGVSGDLNAIRIYLSLLMKNHPDDAKQEIYDDIKAGIEAALENTRAISYNLMPPAMETLGFYEAVKDYLQKLSIKGTIDFEVCCKQETVNIPEPIGYELFRVIQEFTTNILKYSTASSVLINMTQRANAFTMEIIDNGSPFIFMEELTVSRGIGLRNILGRLKVINATLSQEKLPNGNHFTITLKLQHD